MKIKVGEVNNLIQVIQTKIKEEVIGSMLDLMKSCAKEDEKFAGVGLDLDIFRELDTQLWDNIKKVSGMPSSEKVGVWISDYWYELAFDYTKGELSREEVINKIINWETEFEE